MDLTQVRAVAAAERGISGALLRIDRPLGVMAPATRLVKLLAGPTVTDVEGGHPRLGLARIEAAQSLTLEAKTQGARKLLGRLFRVLFPIVAPLA